MDRLKEKTMCDYTSWDINCKFIKSNPKTRKRLINLFTRKARRKLKNDLKKELEVNIDE